MKIASAFSGWTSRETGLGLLFVLGSIVIAVAAHACQVEIFGIVVHILLFALGVLVVWFLGRGPQRRARTGARSRSPRTRK